MSKRPKEAPPETFRRAGEGTVAERWIFDEGVPALRCSWPTVGLLNRIAERAQARKEYDTVAAVQAFAHLMAHPAGVEYAVDRLRSLRRAERGEG